MRIALGPHRAAALLSTAFLFPLGAATLMVPWLLGLRIAAIVKSRRTWWVRSPLDLPIAGFLTLALIAGILSPNPPVAIGSWALSALGFVIVLQFALAALQDIPGLVRRVHQAFAVGTLVASVWGLAIFFIAHVDRARLPAIGPDALGFGLAAGLLLTLPLLDGPPPWRTFAVITLPLAGAGLLLSFTRGALYAVAAGGLVHLALLRDTRVKLGRIGFVVAGAAACAAIVLIPQVSQALVGHLREVSGASSPGGGVALLRKTAAYLFSGESNGDRFFIWRGALRVIAAHPWFGVGLGVFPFVVFNWDPNLPPGMLPHSLYLDLAAEAGIPAALVFLMIPAVAMAAALRRRDCYRDAAVAALAGMLAAEVRDNILIGFHMALGLMLVLALLTAGPRAESAHEV